MDKQKSSTSTELVRASGVVKRYRQGTQEVFALRGVDISIHSGDFAVLAGPSGSGKTTLLNLIGALDKPSEGSLYLEGQDLAAMSSAELARLRLGRVGFVFQAYNLLPVLSALENTELVLELQGMPLKERRARAEEVLCAVGLGDMMHRRPHELSGGQQQRVAVARAIAATRALILADEPTANLDLKTAESLIDLMLELNRTRGTTFLFSSHDPRVVDRARTIVRMEDGRIRAVETAG